MRFMDIADIYNKSITELLDLRQICISKGESEGGYAQVLELIEDELERRGVDLDLY